MEKKKLNNMLKTFTKAQSNLKNSTRETPVIKSFVLSKEDNLSKSLRSKMEVEDFVKELKQLKK